MREILQNCKMEEHAVQITAFGVEPAWGWAGLPELSHHRTLKRWSYILQDKRVEWRDPNRISALRKLRQEDCEYFHCRTWNMARKLKIMENEKHQLDDLKNDEITEKFKK